MLSDVAARRIGPFRTWAFSRDSELGTHDNQGVPLAVTDLFESTACVAHESDLEIPGPCQSWPSHEPAARRDLIWRLCPFDEQGHRAASGPLELARSESPEYRMELAAITLRRTESLQISQSIRLIAENSLER